MLTTHTHTHSHTHTHIITHHLTLNPASRMQAQRAVSTARADYERIHSRLMYEVPQLCDQRVAYYETCMKASIRSQALYYHHCSQTFRSGLSKARGENGVATREELTQLTTKYLDDIKALSIVGGSVATS